jgi:hypothetical protein
VKFIQIASNLVWQDVKFLQVIISEFACITMQNTELQYSPSQKPHNPGGNKQFVKIKPNIEIPVIAKKKEKESLV